MLGNEELDSYQSTREVAHGEAYYENPAMMPPSTSMDPYSVRHSPIYVLEKGVYLGSVENIDNLFIHQ